MKALDANDAAGAETAFASRAAAAGPHGRPGLIHKNKAARHKSRLTARIKALKAA